MLIKKSSLRHWQLISKIFTAHLPILVRCKSKGAVRALCVCAIGNLEMSITVQDGAVTLKGSHWMGGGWIYKKKLHASLVNVE
jgi:hypothetical protein